MTARLARALRAAATPRVVLGAARLGAAVASTLGIAYVLVTVLADNPLARPGTERQALLSVFPQGWGFFTRDVGEVQTHLYHRRDGRWQPLDTHNATRANWFGFDRRSRARHVELTSLLAPLPARVWRPCRVDPATCADEGGPALVAARDESRTRFLCGPLLIARQRPIPLPWYRLAGHFHMPSQIVALDVRCPTSAPSLPRVAGESGHTSQESP